jgi:hypothetical protein
MGNLQDSEVAAVSGERYCHSCGGLQPWKLVCETCLAKIQRPNRVLEELNQAFERELKDYAMTVTRLRKEVIEVRKEVIEERRLRMLERAKREDEDEGRKT